MDILKKAKSSNKIKEIIFQRNIYFGVKDTYHLKIYGNKARCIAKNTFYLDSYFTPEETEHFLKSIEDLNIECWEKEYINHNVLDGERWELSVHYNDGYTKKSSGINAYPDNWNEFLDIWGNIFGIEWDED